MSHQKINVVDAQNYLYSLIDNYSIQLLSILGIGAYGVVYLGQNVNTLKYYAVKLFPNMSMMRPEEAIIHARLSGHQNILKFEKLVHENNMAYIILEYASGGDLFSAITKEKMKIVGNSEVIKHIFLQIIDAVQYCHENNIAHRDLKPENILLGPHLQVKLADFGLATTNSVSEEFGCGSTFYFSPECQGIVENYGFTNCTNSQKEHRLRAYDTQKNDIWSLGVILINLAAGRNPWKQAHFKNNTFAAYVRNPFHFFKRILPCISQELEKILLRIFCLNPSKRISLSELRFLIQNCQSFTQQQPSIKTVEICNRKRGNRPKQCNNQIQPPKTKKIHHHCAPYHYYRNHCKVERKRRYSSPVFKTLL